MLEKLTKFLVIEKVSSTIFFVEEEGNLKQGIDILIENRENPTRANVEIKLGLKKENIEIERVDKGRRSYRIYIPEIQKRMNAQFVLFANGKVQDKKTINLESRKHWQIYLVHLSHHDLGYTDLPTNVLQEHDSFIDDVLRFCEETKEFPFESKFKYTIEQAWSIIHFIKNRPKETIDKLIQFIKKGQIEVTAFFGNEISELCSHEELIRLMYPSFSLKHKYGIPIRSAELADIPGLSWGLVKVLAGAGVKYFAPGLPDYFSWGKRKVHIFWDESSVLPRDLPGAFLWQGQDGAKVLFWYGELGAGGLSWWDYQEAFSKLPDMLDKLEKKDYPFDIIRYRFIGGHRDNSPPALRLSYIVREWNKRWAYPKLIVATNSDFFEQLERKWEKKLPVFRGELPNTDYTVGATSTAKETGINRVTHNQLHSAEKFATISAVVSDYSYPNLTLNKAYEDMLLYDEHTWGMAHPLGPAQEAHWSEKSSFAYRASALSQDVLLKSLNKIVDEIKMPNNDYHIVVFNSLSWKRTEVVRTPLKVQTPCGRPMYLEYPENEVSPRLVSGSAIGRNIINLPQDIIEKSYELIDVDTNERIPYQIVKLNDPKAPVPYASYQYALGGVDPAHLFEIVFIAKDIPPMGYKTYRVIPCKETSDFTSNIEVREESIENRFFKVILDSKMGVIRSIYDKELQRELVDQDASHKLNQLIIRSVETGKEERPGIWRVYKGASGPVYGSLTISGEANGYPQITEEIILYDKIKRIDIFNRILKDSTPFLETYFAFPFKVENPSFRFEGCNSIIEPLKDQFPGSNSDYYTMQYWASVSNKEMGVALSSIEAPVIEFGGLWPGYVSQAHHGITPQGFGHDFLKGGELKKGHMYSYVMVNNFRTNFQPVQVGERLFRYSIFTYKKDWKRGKVYQLKVYQFGWSFQNPLIPVCMKGKKEGTLPASYSFCEVDKPNVLLLTLKQAEDGEGLIMRLMETEGKNTDVKVTLPFFTITKAYQTNLVEENEKILSIIKKHSIEVFVKAFGITTIRVQGI